MRQLNLTYLVSTLGRTGPTNQLFNLVSRLDRGVFHPSIVTISPEPADSLAREFQGLGVRVRSLKLSRIRGILRGPRRLRSLLKQYPADVVHSQGIRPDFLNSTLRYPTTRIATQRNDPFVDYPMLYGQVGGLIMARLHVTILRKLPKVVTCSHTIELSNQCHQLPSTTIQNGIDTRNKYVVSSKEKDAKRETLRLPESVLLFIWAAPFISRKNPAAVIKAFGDAQNSKKKHLCVLGDGPLLDATKRSAAQYGNISFKGKVDNVDDYLMAADCFISTSLSEGLPNSVIEALSWGLPTILSDIPAHREIHQIEKRSGDLFSLDNPHALTELIESFEISGTTAHFARSIVVNHLNADAMAGHYQTLYHSLTNNRSSFVPVS